MKNRHRTQTNSRQHKKGIPSTGQLTASRRRYTEHRPTHCTPKKRYGADNLTAPRRSDTEHRPTYGTVKKRQGTDQPEAPRAETQSTDKPTAPR